jgi:hypothetical protein
MAEEIWFHRCAPRESIPQVAYLGTKAAHFADGRILRQLLS